MTAYIDKLAYLYLKDGKLLSTRNHGNTTWYIPGGKREAGESDEAALIREVTEELTVQLRPETIQHYGTFEAPAHNKPVGTMIRMTCYTAAFDGTIAPDSEIAEVTFFSYVDRDKGSPADKLIFDDLHAKGLLA